MKSSLLYGKRELTLDLPDHIVIYEINKHQMPLVADVDASIRRALHNPIGSPSLPELAKAAGTVCILICDITRPVPNGDLLPPLIDMLMNQGVKKEHILILVATGLHRPNEGEELRELVGSDEIFEQFRIENHFARDRDAHIDLGTTSQGIPVGIDRRFYDADLKIVTGLVEPHFMAGYSGGRKVIAPGVAYQDTILKFHTAHVLEHPSAVSCVMDGNPLHEAQMEIVARVGPVYALNVAIDDRRRLGTVTFGDIERSHLAAVDFMRRYAEIEIDRTFKTIVTSAGGYPLDRTYYQTVKGMVGPMDILAPGGTIIIASDCSEGMGSPEFVAAQQMLCAHGKKKFMDILYSRSVAEIDEWQTEMLLKPLRRGSIRMFTKQLGKKELQQTFVTHVTDLKRAILDSVAEQNDAEIAVIPEGPYVVPRYTGPPVD
ncbi:MAG: nickel-dependent lactate racemase [Desulfofustis sp.]|jgi:nickel-dependent lactate racemase|nr:nickel-dependent lactate racemase [Desulfofustis sp.]